jgi:hypothetical protein
MNENNESDIRVLALYGSPREGGNTDTMLDTFLEGAVQSGARVERLYLRSLSISPCTECGGCAKTGRCVIQDDMVDLYPKLLSYERVVFALPVFFLGPPAVSKGFIDRGQALWIRKNVLGERPEKMRSGFMLSAGGFKSEKVFLCNRRIVRAFFSSCGLKYSGELVRPDMDESGAAASEPGLMDELVRTGRQFACANRQDKNKD